jgi:hypothetical protein
MVDRAQEILRQLQQRVRTTAQIVVDVADSVGVPSVVTSWLRRGDEQSTSVAAAPNPTIEPVRASPRPSVVAAPVATAAAASGKSPKASGVANMPGAKPEASAAAQPREKKPAASVARRSGGPSSRRGKGTAKAKGKRTSAKKRSFAADQKLPESVRALETEMAIDGSTYLARIVWAPGVARMEAAGPLKPADIARMVMARSPVSLEPPNIARYIRRSKPTCIKVDRKEGNSSFYRLNAEGRRLFDQHFRVS